MADKIERIYTVPLRRSFLKVPKWKRTKKSIKTIREFLQKHMKSDNVLLSKAINEKIWERGSKGPPARIKLQVVKEDDVVKAELFGYKPKKEEKPKKGKIKKVEKKEEKEEKTEIEKKKEKEEKMGKPTLRSMKKRIPKK